jgi:Ser/Thr protein kinase RdoA (MazF antagonist)
MHWRLWMSEAEQALGAWGGTDAPIRWIKDRENAVHEVRLRDGTRAALRLHRVGYQTVAAIRSELWWMQALAQAGLSVPLPIPTQNGDLVHVSSSGRVATVIGWVSGEPLGAYGAALEGGAQDKRARFHAIGALVARMHNITDTLTLPDHFQRHSWDAEGLLGDKPFWGRFWENPSLEAGERSLIGKARNKARQALADFRDRGGDFGLIHADVLRENVLFSGETVSIIDFDDCGFGFRLYDLATLASQNESEPDYAALMQAAITGYRSERPLSDADAALLPMFLMLRRFASAGWVISRAAAGDPLQRLYAERAVTAAERFVG